ncbi:hypothetical protein IB211_02406c [Intestinimonas butyriciproducens]|uniref:Uncharacterized protein n=1 Tax=Intestinimonas butyriciproducens TaxID=1297617 RepID=A0A0S2W616_9FIRM|nr:hypothetical protein IB211_02406c [Intestinimonas butyriciproducens]
MFYSILSEVGSDTRTIISWPDYPTWEERCLLVCQQNKKNETKMEWRDGGTLSLMIQIRGCHT